MNVAIACDTTAPSASVTVDSTYATWRVSCATSPRTASASPTFGRAPGLVRHVEGGDAVARLERAVGGEVHRRVVDHAVHAAVDDAERVAGELGRRPRRLGPALAVALERHAELPEQRHAAVAERAIQVAHRVRLPGTTATVARDRGSAHAHRRHRRRHPHAARAAQRRSSSGWHPVDLAAHVLAHARRCATTSTPRVVDDVIIGCVSQVGEQALNIEPQRAARRRASPTPCPAPPSTGSAVRRSRRCTSPRRA